MWALENHTPFQAERACLLDAAGARVWVVVVKGTFEVDRDGQLILAGEQLPVAREARYAGEPGASEMLHDADLVVNKPTTDLLVLGQAHAPPGSEEATVPVSIQVTGEQGVLVSRQAAVAPGESAGFGPVAPFQSPRAELAGTFDEQWRQQRAPLLPEDTDDAFNLCAPREQRPAAHLTGGETVTIQNLCPEGTLELVLPRVVLTFRSVFGPNGQGDNHLARLHTVLVEPEARRVQLVWQTHLACHQKVYSLQKTVIRMLEDVDIGGSGEDGEPLDLLDAQPTLPRMGGGS